MYNVENVKGFVSINDASLLEKIDVLCDNYKKSIKEKRERKINESIDLSVKDHLKNIFSLSEDTLETLFKIYFILYPSPNKTICGLDRFISINKDLSKEEIEKKYANSRRY